MSSSNSIIDVSFFTSLSSSCLTSVTASMNELSGRNQCSGAELLSMGEVCGVCHIEGGDLTHCLQCLQRFHEHCHDSKGRAICSSCSRPWGSSAEKEAESSKSLQQGSIDGILQWAFHNISRPLPDSQGYYQ
ncbi:autoimmune regulator isoform X6 [Perca fluviatilis]|uniref:autoimmune regulator isoform X6 n=1 Tax=Perca fluviatilis TaxID=8168 RepID=UPI001964FE03|nr:autoimmune regulator isoform X6 [Perca fluviatilis]